MYSMGRELHVSNKGKVINSSINVELKAQQNKAYVYT